MLRYAVPQPCQAMCFDSIVRTWRCTVQVADALSLQFRLPPPGVPPPLPRASQDVLGGCPAVDALLLTSVWAVAALRQLAKVSNPGGDSTSLALHFHTLSHVIGLMLLGTWAPTSAAYMGLSGLLCRPSAER